MKTTPETFTVETPVATIWIAYLPKQGAQYYYGGSRLVECSAGDADVVAHLSRLAREESELKNELINRILTSNESSGISRERLPVGVVGSRVGGGRCLIRPRSPELHGIFSDPAHPRFEEVLQSAFAAIGDKLNELDGLVKLTPDFGRFANCSDYLYAHTKHVLGIGCELGGCGGKSSYSTSGILGGMERAGLLEDANVPVTVIGSAGALGSELVEHLSARGFKHITLCDISYDAGTARPRAGYPVIPAEEGRFTDEAMRRGGMVIAATWGHELERSSYWEIPAGTRLVLAHNLCLPSGDEGLALARFLHEAGVTVIPGALLTLGGALTSRLEWFHRQKDDPQPFDKAYAHELAYSVVSELTRKILEVSAAKAISPYAAMHEVALTEGA